jgi:hypothetical protein
MYPLYLFRNRSASEAAAQAHACAYFWRVVTKGECLPTPSNRETALFVSVVAACFVVLPPVGHDSEGQGLDAGDRLIFGGTVGQRPVPRSRPYAWPR